MEHSVAIIMPYYKERYLLEKSLAGIRSQTHTNWHLYLIDDGSGEFDPALQASSVIWDNFRDLYKKITIVWKPNSGVSNSRNLALKMISASASYIAYCDADDIWDADYLEKQVLYLTSHFEAFVYARPRCKFEDGTNATAYGIPDPIHKPTIQQLKAGNFIYMSGVVHSSFYNKYQFDGRLNGIEDWDYWMQFAKAGVSICYNPFTSFTYTCKQNGNGSKLTPAITKLFHDKYKYLDDVET